jgi:hypothetical protein
MHYKDLTENAERALALETTLSDEQDHDAVEDEEDP